MKKVLKISGITLIVILALLLLSPLLFRQRIEGEVKKLANRTLKSEMNFSGMDLSFFRHFPYLSLTLSDFTLMSSEPFRKDTLISARDIAFGIDLSSLFGKTLRINRIYFNRARINILYNMDGNANFNVYESADTAQAKAETDTSAGSGLRIERIIFKDCRVVYADPSLPVRIDARRLNYSGTSSLTEDIFHLESNVRIDSLDVEYGAFRIVESKPVTARLTTRVNTRDLTIVFEKNDLKVKDIPLQFTGKFNFEKTGYQVNLNFLSVLDKEFLSARFKIRQYDTLWISARVNAGIDLSRWSKALGVNSMDLRGFYEFNLAAEGSYATGPVKKGIRGATDTAIVSIPQFTFMTRLTNGFIKYHSLPRPLEQISFSLNAGCPGHDYHAISVELKDFRASFLKNAITANFSLKNLTDWPVEGELKAGLNLAELKQVIPLDSIDLTGQFRADIKVNGNYLPDRGKFPVTQASLSLENGSVLTKYYPNPIREISVKAGVTSRSGSLKDLSVNILPVTFRFEDQPFTLHAALEDFDDLKYDIRANGVIDLGKIYRVFSREGIDLKGYIEADLALKGRQSDAAAGRYTRLDNRGTLKLRDIAVRSDYFPKPFVIRSGEFGFDREKFRVDAMKAEYGSSDFLLRGYTLNTISYFLSKGTPLKGELRLASNLINADEFRACAMEMSDTGQAAPAAAGVVMLPRDLDLLFSADVKKILFEGLEIFDLKGSVGLKEGILSLKETGFTLIGCRVAMDALYGDVTPEKGFFDFHVKADDFDVRRAYHEVIMIRELAPSTAKAEGIVSLDYAIKGNLDADMLPVMPSLEGGGVFSLRKVKVYGLKLFNDIGKGIERENLKNPDLSKVDIKSTIKNSTVTFEQFKFKVKGIRLKISGSTTFDSRMNLKVRVGLGPLGIIGIPLRISGTMDDLKIKYGRGGDEEALPDSSYSDKLPAEMLDRIKNAKESDSDEEPENK